MTLWSGRVGTQLSVEAWEFLKADDAELLPYDIQGTLLHAERLHAAGLLDDAELADVRATLARLEAVDPDATSPTRARGPTRRSSRSRRRSSTAPPTRRTRRCPATRTSSARSR
jgi:hypothetical protein